MKEIKIIRIGVFLLLFFSCSFVGSNDFFYQTNGKDQSNIGLIKEEKEMEREPLLLDSNVYDHYANGEIVNRGSSTNPLPRVSSTSSHPITKDEFQLINLEEFVILPIPVEPVCMPVLYQDAGLSFQGWHLFTDAMQIYSDYYHGYIADIASGDVDGDGYDEVIIANSVGSWGNIIVYDDANSSYAKIIDFTVQNPAGHYNSITTGDVDGDGCDEIIYTRYIPGFTIPEGIQCSVALWVYEVVPTWKCLTSYNFYVKIGYWDAHDIIEFYSNNGFMMEPEVACGDFDGDGCDEIACAFSFRNDDPNYEDFWILDDYLHQFQKIWWGNVIEKVTGDIDLAAGDFDGDGVDEIAYAGCPWNGEQLEGQLAIINNIGIMNYEIIRLPKVDAPGGVWVHRFPVACGDIDGDGRDEIGVVRAYRENYPGDLFLYEYSPTTGNYVLIGKKEKDFMDFGLSMGDVDCDGLAEIVCAGRFYMGVLDDAQHSFNVLMQNLAYGGLVACGDFDGDGMRLKYTGESWTNTAPPGVITVIAAPPLYAGIDQNYLSSYTAFGQETSIGTGLSSEIGTSVSTTFSFEYAFDFDYIEFFKFSWSRTMGKEFARTNTVTKTVTKTVSYATGWTDDAVIYHSTNYNSYKYQIIHHPYNSSYVGRYMTIDVPDSPTIVACTVKYFDSKFEPTIGSETFNHTAGRPWTYLSRNESARIAPVCWSSGEQLVGQGSGFTTVTIEVAKETSSAMKRTVFSGYAWGIAICGAGFTKSSSIFESNLYEISIGETAVYQGCIGFIGDNKTWEKLNYTYNLLVYYLDHPSGCTYQVINYYVEGAVPYNLVGVFFYDNWQLLTYVGSGIAGLAIVSTITIVVVKRRKQKPVTSKKTKKTTSSKKNKKK